MSDTEKPEVNADDKINYDTTSVESNDIEATPEPTPAQIKRAEAYKQEGNEFFAKGKYEDAVESYSDAITLVQSFVYFSNRANAFIKLESYGSAIIDAKKAIELDPTNPKGPYRLGTAYFLLGKYKLAKKAFLDAYKLKPGKLFKESFEKSKAEARRVAFENAIASDHTALIVETYKISDLSLPDNYDGPVLQNLDSEVDAVVISPNFVMKAIEWMFDQKLIPKKMVAVILRKSYYALKALPSMLEIDFVKAASAEVPAEEIDQVTFNVCGDTHGQFYDLKNIFELNGYPGPKNQYLFNGDFVDRGSFSVEVIMTMLLYKLAYPSYFHILRGNHETRNMNRIYGFDGEVEHKYDSKILNMFAEVFRVLPLCAVINGKVIVMHGGLPVDDGVKIAEFKNISREREPPEMGLMSDLLWSDPQPFNGRAPSKRGVGKSFGPDVTKQFLEDNKLELLIRSHEVRDEGYLEEHDGKLITVFSAPNYCDHMGNKGAVVRLKQDLKPSFFQFEAVAHPDVKPLAYAGNMSLFS